MRGEAELYDDLVPKSTRSGKTYDELRLLTLSAVVALDAARYTRERNREMSPRSTRETSTRETSLQEAIQNGESVLDTVQQQEREGGIDAETMRLAAAVTLNALGQLLRVAGQFREARDRFFEAVVRSPGFVEAYFELGQLFLSKKGALGEDWPQQAERMLQEARRLNPSRTEATVELARLYIQKVFSRHQEALDLLKTMGPSVHIAKLRAEAYRALGKIPEALKELRLAMPLDPDDRDLREIFVAFALAMPESPEQLPALREAHKMVQQRIRTLERNGIREDERDELRRLENSLKRLEEKLQDE